MTNTTIPNVFYPVANGYTSDSAFVDQFSTRNPTVNDVNYPIQKKWLNTATGQLYELQNFVSFNGLVTANWILIGSMGLTETLTGNTGGAVPATANNINVVGDGTYITTVGTPGTSTLTIEPTGGLTTLYTEDSGTAVASAGNLNVFGGTGITTSGSGNTITISSVITTDLHTAKFIVGDLARGANYTTVAAAYAAAVTLGAPQTVYLQDGIYTENITGVSGINISSFSCNGLVNGQGGSTPNVILKGTFTANYTGSVTISGIQLQTNGAAALAIGGSGSGSITLLNCSINANDSTAITLNNTLFALNCYGCTFGNSSTNNLWAETSSAGIDFENCVFSTNGTASASTMAVGRAVFNACDMHGVNVTTTGTGGIFVNCSYWQYGGQTLLALTGTGTSEAYNSYIRSDNATTITVDSGTILNIANCVILGTATNIFTGAGTMNSSNLTFQSSKGNTVSVQNSYEVGKVFSSAGITFDNTNVLNVYEVSTFTPTLVGGSVAGSTTYTNQQGYYTRIGNIVYVMAQISISAATGTGDVTLGGLPFTIKNQTNGNPTGSIFWQGGASWTWGTGATDIALTGQINTTTCKVWGQGSVITGAFVAMANAALQVNYSLVYQI
jgi:hypothetical protein